MNKKLIISDLSLVLENNKDKNKVLTNVNFDLEESEIGCILGPSGCGKSSLLRAIAGFDESRSPVIGECPYPFSVTVMEMILVTGFTIH